MGDGKCMDGSKLTALFASQKSPIKKMEQSSITAAGITTLTTADTAVVTYSGTSGYEYGNAPRNCAEGVT